MTNLSHIYSDIVCDRTFRKTAGLLVAKSGMRSDLKGYTYLIDAVILYGTGASESFCEIYRIIGEMRRLKTKTVMRELSYCIAQSSSISDGLTALTGVAVKPMDVHCGMVISCLGEVFKHPDPSLYD